MKKLRQIDWLVLLLGIVFLSASIYRIFNFQDGSSELNQLGIPGFFTYFVIVFEIIIGGCFLFNKKVKEASILTIIFLVMAIIIALISNFNTIFININELFIFNPTPTDILLHCMYIILLIIIFIKYKNTEKPK